MKNISFALVAVIVLYAMPVLAQEAQNSVSQPNNPDPAVIIDTAEPGVPAEAPEGLAGQANELGAEPTAETQGFNSVVFNKDEYGSILFTHWEYVAIQDNINARGSVRPVTQDELDEAMIAKMTGEERPKPPPEERELRLAGIVYEGSDEWAFWLNEKRYTPEALPKEALDLKVYKSYIEMKWYDEWSNKIYPIRLRPHQRFNIDTRIFLPGS